MALDRNYHRYPSRLADWCQTRIRSQQGYDLIRQLFAYDPDKRLTAKEALAHKWFQEDLRPTRNVFFPVSAHHLPPQRRITQDEAPSMMGIPAPTQAQTLSQVAPGHGQAQGQHLSQQSQVNLSQQSKPGSTAASFGSVSGGAVGSFSGGQGSSARKKPRIG